MRRLYLSLAGLVILLVVPLYLVSERLFATERLPAEMIVVLADHQTGPDWRPVNQGRAWGVARAYGLSPSQVYGSALTGFAARVPSALLTLLEEDPEVRYLSPNRPVGIPEMGIASPCASNPNHWKCGGDGGDGGSGSSSQLVPWGVSRIGAFPAGAPLDGDNASVHVYVIDTGIDLRSADLTISTRGYAAPGKACSGKRNACPEPWQDDNWHGTHVAGIIGARDNEAEVVGVAPGVVLHAVKVLSSSGSGSYADVIAGIDWMVNDMIAGSVPRPAVANMSLAGNGSRQGACSSGGYVGSDALHQSICSARNLGVLFTVAAGNNGWDAESQVPAAYDDAVFTVSATSASDNWPTWSNWGDGTAYQPGGDAPLLLAAPGAEIPSTKLGGGVKVASGTSMAAPHVAGVLALMIQRNSWSGDASAFDAARTALLSAAEDTWVGSGYTGSWVNTSGHPHEEPFLQAPLE